MQKQLRIMMIGAHPDDCEFCCGGLALKYTRAGHMVRFLSLCNGNGGHHILSPEATAARRREEANRVAALAGISYDIWDVSDCELMADLENRKRLVRHIREFCPDVIFSHRSNDYHADHRAAALLVQDASYLLIVPHFCPEVPAMKKMPVIMHFHDYFSNPPFCPDMVVATDDVIDDKFRLLACHESQLFEWLPYTEGTLDTVPADPLRRLQWLREPCLPAGDSLPSPEQLRKYARGSSNEYREAAASILYREKLLQRYGQAGTGIRFAEAYAVSEYGTPLTEASAAVLFPL